MWPRLKMPCKNVYFFIYSDRAILYKKKGKQTYAKLDYCYYCKRGFSARISKHLMNTHTQENKVQRAKLGGDQEKKAYSIQTSRS